MSLNCENVKDYVALYNDNCLSETTVNEINEHLSECPSCRKYYKSYENLEADTKSAFASDDYHYENEKSDKCPSGCCYGSRMFCRMW